MQPQLVKALDVAINVGIMLAISAGIKLISKGIDYLVNYSKNLKEAANAIKEEYDGLKENQESLINQQKRSYRRASGLTKKYARMTL